MVKPLVSVIIPTCDRPGLLRKTLASVARQTWDDFEVLVVDDGSREDPTALVASFGPRFRCFRQARAWVAAARNRGVAEARGELLAFLDDDDLWHPRHLEAAVTALANRPTAGWSVCAGTHLLPDGTTPAAPPFPERDDALLPALLRSNFILSPAVVVRREVFAAAGGVIDDPAIRFGEDWLLWLSCAALAPAAVTREALVQVRRHGANMTSPSPVKLADQARSLEAVLNRFADRFPGLVADGLAGLQAHHQRSMAITSLMHGYRLTALRITLRSLRYQPINPRGWALMMLAAAPRWLTTRLLQRRTES